MSHRGPFIRAVPFVLGVVGVGLLLTGRSDGMAWGLIVLALACVAAAPGAGGRRARR